MKADKNAPVSVCAILDDRVNNRTGKYEQEWNGFWQFFNVMQFAKEFVAVSRNGIDAHAYNALPFGQTTAAAEDTTPAQARNDGWTEIRELIFDEETARIADELEKKSIMAPEEAGYELADDSGEVIAEIELAWTTKKIGYMTEAQQEDRDKAEGYGWKIFTSVEEIDTVFKEE